MSFIRRNSLSLVTLLVFFLCVAGLVLTGHDEFNAEQIAHHGPTISLSSYLVEGHFWEAMFENWESEFLQMGAYILLTVFLVQKGSAESKDPDSKNDVDELPSGAAVSKDAPWPVRRGGIWLRLYENSLLIAFVLLFGASMVGHAFGGVDDYNAEQLAHHQHTVTTWGYFTSSRFWFESFQNWQSEFLAVLSIVVLTVFLRQRGSPESKPVATPHGETPTS
jgi:hypothetical protein